MGRVTPARPDRRRRGPLGRLLRPVLWVALLGALLLPVGVAARIVHVAGRDERVPADAIVVLGAAQLDGRPAEVLTARLEHSLQLYQQGLAPRVVTTGGQQEGDRFTEADAGQSWLVEHGVPAEAVVPVPVGGNTYDSLVAVAEVARAQGWASTLVVSDRWHLYRVLTMSEDLGLPVVGASPTGSGPSAGPVTGSLGYILRETAAVVVHRVESLLGRRA